MYSWPISNAGQSGHTGPSSEISATWAIIFGKMPSTSSLRRVYSAVERPHWLITRTEYREFQGYHLGKPPKLGDLLSLDNLRWYPDIESRLTGLWVHFDPAIIERNGLTVELEHFPIYEHRLLALRLFMDQQTPRTLQQLWQDNRDSLAFYTFWGVIIFGGVSVILAAFSLALSVAQTVASYKILN